MLSLLPGCVRSNEANPSPDTCEYCKGTGRVKCVFCNGDGKVPKRAGGRARAGAEMARCETCYGDGGFQCAMCKGSGRRKDSTRSFHPGRTPKRVEQ